MNYLVDHLRAELLLYHYFRPIFGLVVGDLHDATAGSRNKCGHMGRLTVMTSMNIVCNVLSYHQMVPNLTRWALKHL